MRVPHGFYGIWTAAAFLFAVPVFGLAGLLVPVLLVVAWIIHAAVAAGTTPLRPSMAARKPILRPEPADDSDEPDLAELFGEDPNSRRA